MRRLIYHKFEDNRTSKQWPKKVSKPEEIQEYASKIKAKKNTINEILFKWLSIWNDICKF